KEGYQHVTLLQVPGMGHEIPEAEWFEKGILALDEIPPRPAAPPPATVKVATTLPTTQRPQTEPIDPSRDAERLLSLAESYIANGAYASARTRLEKIIS